MPVGNYLVSARVWAFLVATLALGATAWATRWGLVSGGDALAFTLAAIGAAVAHRYPIRSAFNAATYPLTNVLIMAGLIVLPPALLTPLVAAAITPDAWMRRHRPGAWFRWLFNLSQTALASHVAAAWLTTVGPYLRNGPAELAGCLMAALLFVLTQAAVVGIMIALNSQIPVRRTDTLTSTALLSDGLICLLGILVAGLWQTKPALLLLAVPVLVIIHRITRTAHLSHLAQVDVKTGLHNHRFFEQALEEEIGRSSRLRRPLALLFADMDMMRHVNNTYGHLAGDLVLREVATILNQSVRKTDVIARFGGEEFAVLLPQTAEDEAAYYAERIRKGVEEHPFVLDDGTVLRCTISIGAAVFPQDGPDLTSLVKRADMAMYRAKETRNAVALASAVQAAAPTNGGQASPAPAGTPAPGQPGETTPWPGFLLGGAVAGAVGMVSASVMNLSLSGAWWTLFLFTGLAAVAELLHVQVYQSGRQRITISFTSALTMATMVIAPPIAPLVSLTAACLHVILRQQQRQLDKALFNLANPTVAAGIACAIHTQLTGLYGPSLLISLLASVAFHMANTGGVTLMVSLLSGRSLLMLLRESAGLGLINLALGLTGAFLGQTYGLIGSAGVLIFLLPLLLLRYTLVLYDRQSRETITTLQAAMAQTEAAQRGREETLRSLIETVSSLIDIRDQAVSGHSRRVATYAVALGRQLQVEPGELAELYTAGLLHDVGKIAIPEAILNKPARLTPQEYEVIKTHSSIGRQILWEVKPLRQVALMVGDHHERFDGTGYPSGKAGGQISLGGRLLSVADALDSILSNRPYAAGKGLDWALVEINRCAGGHFDPAVVEALNRLLEAVGPSFFITAGSAGEAASPPMAQAAAASQP